MNETPLFIKGQSVREFERIGFIDGRVHWAFELEDGTFLTLTSRQFGEWVKASELPDIEPELNVIQSAGVCALIVSAVAAIWTVWAVKVGLL